MEKKPKNRPLKRAFIIEPTINKTLVINIIHTNTSKYDI